jgi:hypothetical protein
LCATDDRGGRLLSEKPSEEAFKAFAASNTSGDRERERQRETERQGETDLRHGDRDKE